MNPKTVLAWVFGSIGVPESLTGMLVPIRESGSMLPQASFARWVCRRPIRKKVWVLGASVQGGSVLGMAVVGYVLEGSAAGFCILSLLVLFSLSRALCSMSSKDVLGKTIPKSQRGRVTGLATSLSQLLVMGVGILLVGGYRETFLSESFSPLPIIAAAGLCWWIAALLYSGIREPFGEANPDARSLSFRTMWDRLVRDSPFLRFLLARGFLIATALSAPYCVRVVQKGTDGGIFWLGLFILAQGVAVGVSGYAWGKLSDRSSRKSMAAGGMLASLAALCVGALALGDPRNPSLFWTGVFGFFLLSVGHNGVRIGRKTYVVNMAEGNRRTEYVSVSNTVTGILLLLSGVTGSFLSRWLGPGGILVVLGVCAMSGAFFALWLPEQEGER